MTYWRAVANKLIVSTLIRDSPDILQTLNLNIIADDILINAILSLELIEHS